MIFNTLILSFIVIPRDIVVMSVECKVHFIGNVSLATCMHTHIGNVSLATCMHTHIGNVSLATCMHTHIGNVSLATCMHTHIGNVSLATCMHTHSQFKGAVEAFRAETGSHARGTRSRRSRPLNSNRCIGIQVISLTLSCPLAEQLH